MSIIKDIIRLVKDEFVGQVKRDFEGYANRILRRLVRTLILGVVGTTFIAVGFVFILIGIVTGLSQMMSSWLAWAIVGLIAALVGSIFLLLIRR